MPTYTKTPHLPFSTVTHTRRRKAAAATGTLSQSELQRIVADMID